MRILIVDDEEHLRRVMRLTLEASGHQVTEAANGEEGLRRFGEGHHVDVTLLDQRMPGRLDGLETLRRMKQQRGDATIIMVTAYATIDLAVDAMKLGATDFVRKPMTPETLRRAIDAAVARRGTPPPAPAGEPHPAAGAEPAPRPDADLWTTNGFVIRRAGTRPGRSAEHLFVVTQGRDTAGAEVVVALDEAVIERIARDSRRPLGPAGAYWRRQAERALVKHLWTEAALPEGGRLVLDRASGSMVDDAISWTED